jgi:DNA-binding NtrC family response regulator
MKVLICEDDVLAALDLELILEEAGHRSCGMASAARLGAARAAEWGAEAALVDLRLADGETGADLALRLAEQGLPVIVVTGDLASAPRHELIVGAIAKPIEARRLKELLARAERVSAERAVAQGGGGR